MIRGEVFIMLPIINGNRSTLGEKELSKVIKHKYATIHHLFYRNSAHATLTKKMMKHLSQDKSLASCSKTNSILRISFKYTKVYEILII